MAEEQELYKMIKRDMPSKIIGVEEETHDTKVYRLEVPQDFRFFAGQFIMLKVDIDESRGFKVLDSKPTIQSRAYSIASSPMQKGIIDLLIKKREKYSKVSVNQGRLLLHGIRLAGSMRK